VCECARKCVCAYRGKGRVSRTLELKREQTQCGRAVQSYPEDGTKVCPCDVPRGMQVVSPKGICRCQHSGNQTAKVSNRAQPCREDERGEGGGNDVASTTRDSAVSHTNATAPQSQPRTCVDSGEGEGMRACKCDGGRMSSRRLATETRSSLLRRCCAGGTYTPPSPLGFPCRAPIAR